MPGPRRTWSQMPLSPALSTDVNDWGNWVTAELNQVQTALFPPAAPMVTTVPHPSSIYVAWNEVQGADRYAAFETTSPSSPPGVPIATVTANLGAQSNGFLRSNITDTTTRYYSVQAITQNGLRSAVSNFAPGAALSSASATSAISQEPLDQNGVGGGFGGGGGITGIKSNVNPV